MVILQHSQLLRKFRFLIGDGLQPPDLLSNLARQPGSCRREPSGQLLCLHGLLEAHCGRCAYQASARPRHVAGAALAQPVRRQQQPLRGGVPRSARGLAGVVGDDPAHRRNHAVSEAATESVHRLQQLHHRATFLWRRVGGAGLRHCPSRQATADAFPALQHVAEPLPQRLHEALRGVRRRRRAERLAVSVRSSGSPSARGAFRFAAGAFRIFSPRGSSGQCKVRCTSICSLHPLYAAEHTQPRKQHSDAAVQAPEPLDKTLRLRLLLFGAGGVGAVPVVQQEHGLIHHPLPVRLQKRRGLCLELGGPRRHRQQVQHVQGAKEDRHPLPDQGRQALDRVRHLRPDANPRRRFLVPTTAECLRPYSEHVGTLLASLRHAELQLRDNLPPALRLPAPRRAHVPSAPELVPGLVEGHAPRELRAEFGDLAAGLKSVGLQSAAQGVRQSAGGGGCVGEPRDLRRQLLHLPRQVRILLTHLNQLPGPHLQIRHGGRTLLLHALLLQLKLPLALVQLHVQPLVLLDLHVQLILQSSDLFLRLLDRLLLLLPGDQATDRPSASLLLPLLHLLQLRRHRAELLGDPAVLELQVIDLLQLLPHGGILLLELCLQPIASLIFLDQALLQDLVRLLEAVVFLL
mmetsp:Transcript_38734/g.111228  ORF Transcript_38734/g.111228 Transcript_38734/m.111228 type:complete len:632 (-) Transcript_38734:7-1902(-)